MQFGCHFLKWCGAAGEMMTGTIPSERISSPVECLLTMGAASGSIPECVHFIILKMKTLKKWFRKLIGIRIVQADKLKRDREFVEHQDAHIQQGRITRLELIDELEKTRKKAEGEEVLKLHFRNDNADLKREINEWKTAYWIQKNKVELLRVMASVPVDPVELTPEIKAELDASLKKPYLRKLLGLE